MENTSDAQPLTDEYAHWIPEFGAAAYLGMSPRTLREFCRTNPDEAPERRLCPQPGAKPTPKYNPDDLRALRASRNPPRVQPADLEPSLSPYVGQELGFLQALVTAADALGKRLAPLPPASAPTPLPLFLTIHQAAEYSGLSRTLLRRLCRNGILPAWNDRGGRKIRRVDLENLADLPDSPNGNGSH